VGKHKSVDNEYINLRSVFRLNIRDCLCKVYSLIFVSNIILPETLNSVGLTDGRLIRNKKILRSYNRAFKIYCFGSMSDPKEKKRKKKLSVLNLFPANLAHWKLRKLLYFRPSFFSSFRHIPPSGGFWKVSELAYKSP